MLTGSEQFRLSNAISQSLAGRTALLRLLPFSLSEPSTDRCKRCGRRHPLTRGSIPEFSTRDSIRGKRSATTLRPTSSATCADWEKSVTCRASGPSSGCAPGESASWPISPHSVRTPAFPTPQRGSGLQCWKRATSSFAAAVPREHTKAPGQVPQAYFYDVGLASYLIGIENAGQVVTHPLRGALFENAVVAEALKHRFNRGLQANLSFFRDARGLECDLFYETGRGIGAIEVKAGSTISSDYFRLNQPGCRADTGHPCQDGRLWGYSPPVPEPIAR